MVEPKKEIAAKLFASGWPHLEEGHKVCTYYRRNANNAPVVTVCILKKPDGTFCRGIAFCSPLDSVDRATGRLLAIGRALAVTMEKVRVIREYPNSVLDQIRLLEDDLRSEVRVGSVIFKGRFQVTPTAFESKMFQDNEEVAA